MAGTSAKGVESLREGPPGTWEPIRRVVKRALEPVERFLAIEASSGIVLLLAAAVAIVWANSPWRDSYAALWHTPIGLRVGPFSFERDLHFVINDGVMTIFFFVVALEIRRELHHGELSEWRRASLPVAAALGGMIVPATVYLAVCFGLPSARGWGIPMATDIAFAVGVLTLLGARVPPAIRVLLLALAVIDDIGAIVVIATFYSSGFAPVGLLIFGGGLLGIMIMKAVGVRSPWLYVLPGIGAWAGAYAAGVHPTLAGVAVGLMTPVRPWLPREKFVEHAEASLDAARQEDDLDERALLPHLDRLKLVRREAVSPVERLQHDLHGWVAFGAMPLFALANAGVSLGDADYSGESLRVMGGVTLGLALGKPVGVLGFAWVATRVGLARLPLGTSWTQLAIVGVVSGIGFTMSIFTAGLAFPEGMNLEIAKVGVLLASGMAAIVAYSLGLVTLPATGPTKGAWTEAEAEASTEL